MSNTIFVNKNATIPINNLKYSSFSNFYINNSKTKA